MIDQGTCDGLPYPPCGVGGKFVSLLVVKFLGRTNQAETAFLNQVLKAQAPVHVFLGDRNHKTQVRLHHLFLGASTQHQAAAETDQGHFHKGCPFFLVRLLSVVTFELGSELLEV